MGVDAKVLALGILEDSVKRILSEVVYPLADEYVAEKNLSIGGIDVGPFIMPFVKQLEERLLLEVAKIDGK